MLIYNREPLHNYRAFKEESHLKEYNKFIGFFLMIGGKALIIKDENSKYHFVRKNDLRNLDRDFYELPKLNRKILIQQVISLKSRVLQFPSDMPKEEQTRVERFLELELPKFKASGLDDLVIDATDDFPYTIDFRKSRKDEAGDRGSIYLIEAGKKPFNLIKGSEKEFVFHWPKNQILGLNEEEMGRFKQYLRDNRDDWSQEDLEKPRRIKVPGLPSILLIPNEEGKVERVILLPKRDRVGIVGKGSYKKVKYAYDLTRGERLVNKPLEQKERDIAQNVKGKKGFLPLAGERDKGVNATTGKQEFRHFEPLCDGTLDGLLTVATTKEQKMRLIKDLLGGLTRFHEMRTGDNRPYFHSDLKLENILYKKDADGMYRAYISDFGLSNRTRGFAGTGIWVSPEHAQGWLRVNAGETGVPAARGQELDVWGMGMIIASLMRGKKRLPCLQRHGDPNASLAQVAALTQDRITREINALRDAEPDPAFKGVWDILEGMLKVDPDERITSEEALEEFRLLRTGG